MWRRALSFITPVRVNVVVLLCLLAALWRDVSWPWGLLFIFWAVPALRLREVHLVGPISRDDTPLLFWTVTVLWVALGALMVMEDLAPELLIYLYSRIL